RSWTKLVLRNCLELGACVPPHSNLALWQSKRKGGETALPTVVSAYLLHFFMHLLVAASHVMSFIFSQSAFVVGIAGSVANAGAVNASTRAAKIALLRSLADMLNFLLQIE